MTYDEITEEIVTLLCDDPSVPSMPTGGFEFGLDFIGFGDPAWYVFKRIWGVSYDRRGQFVGVPSLSVPGGRDYIFRQSQPNFAFIRNDGEVIVPKTMKFDGGSIPRIFWAIPGLNPWDYMPAFVLHDWDFVAHAADPNYPRSFDDANSTLAEAIYTLMVNGTVAANWRVLVAIYTACSSIIGKRLWTRKWSDQELNQTLNP